MAQTRIYVSSDSLYGEEKTLGGWTEWLAEKFNHAFRVSTYKPHGLTVSHDD